MSMQHCHQCDTTIDTDYNAEHFFEDVEECETIFNKKYDSK